MQGAWKEISMVKFIVTIVVGLVFGAILARTGFTPGGSILPWFGPAACGLLWLPAFTRLDGGAMGVLFMCTLAVFFGSRALFPEWVTVAALLLLIGFFAALVGHLCGHLTNSQRST